MADESKIPESTVAQPAPELQTILQIGITQNLFNKLVSLATSESVTVQQMCINLLQQAINTEMLSTGTISNFSDEAVDTLKNVNLESVLEGLRVFGVMKSPVLPADEHEKPVLREGDIIFNTTSEIKDFVEKINAVRIKKGLAPLELSLCELLYHYGLTLGDYSVCEDVTGIPYNKFETIFRTLALNEREANGAKSNIIHTGKVFNKFSIVNTPDAVLPEAKPATQPAPDANEKKATK
jgi:hypothetical protein